MDTYKHLSIKYELKKEIRKNIYFDYITIYSCELWTIGKYENDRLCI